MNTATKLLIPAGLLLAATSHATVIFDEAFAAGERTNFTAGTSAAWFSSAGASNVVYTADTSITQNTGTSGRHLVAYFTADGSPATITQGETLRVDFTITFNNPAALASASNNFRFGVFNSDPGTRVAVDSHGGTSASATFDNYLGYAGMFNLGSNALSTSSIRERTVSTNQGLIATAGAFTTLGATDSPLAAFSQNSAYAGHMSLTRTLANELVVEIGMNGTGVTNYLLSRTDDSPSTFAYDTFAAILTSNTAEGFTISELTVSVVPEPSAFAALAGIAALGFVSLRRRRA